MLGTRVKCPNKVPCYAGYISDPHFKQIGERTCGYEGYEIIQRGVFKTNSGFDPLAIKVRCRECKHEYLVFPSIKYEDRL